MMRIAILALGLILAGCVSQSSVTEVNPGTTEAEDAARARISLGLTYLQNGNYAQAKRNLDRAIEYAPRSPQVHFSLAYYFQTVGEVERAESSYQRALTLAPRDADIANSYGAFMCEQGNYDKAKEFFLKAVNSSKYANAAESYENLALCAQSNGDSTAAITYFEQALNHQPARARTLYYLAEIYIQTQQWTEAEAMLRRYEKAAPVSAELLYKWVEVYRGTGEINKASGYGDMLLSMYPQHPLSQKFLQTRQAFTPKASVVNKVSMITSDLQQGEQLPRFHIVEKEENLYRISLKYNVKMARLREWNGLSANATIRPGMKLWLVPSAEQTQ